MNPILVCRMQDAEGRGPYRPGFSHKWSERETGPDPIYIAFPNIGNLCRHIVSSRGGSVGCAFRTTEQARAWFSPNEVLTLLTYGYGLVWLYADEVIAENHDQAVIWCPKPLRSAVIARGWRESA